MSVNEEIRSQIIGALVGAKFPINTPEELLNAMPAGANTCCKAGDVEVTAGEAGKLLQPEDFPFSSAEQVADTIVDEQIYNNYLTSCTVGTYDEWSRCQKK